MKPIAKILVLIPFIFCSLNGETEPGNAEEAQAASISIEQRTILKRSFYKRSTWIPTPEQTNQAMLRVFEFINGVDSETNSFADVKKSQFILENLDKLGVQFIGIGKGDRQIIWCNFFPLAEHKDWKRFVAFSSRNNALYWSMEYCPADDKPQRFNYTWASL